MELLRAWVLFPAVLGLLGFGLGRLLELAAGRRLPGALLLPAGTATLIVVAGLLTAWSATASLATPAVVGLAAAGCGSTIPWRRGRVDTAALAAALATFAVYAAPVVLSGAATFTGMIKLDDIATFLAFTDQVLEHGRDLSGLDPSSHEAALAVNLDFGYPVGAFLPLGIGAKLTGTDPAWVFQPCQAFYAAMLALTLVVLLRRLVPSPWPRAAAASIAAQPALLYGYSLWGGIKEVAAAGLIALLAATMPQSRDDLVPWRRPLPFAVGGAALLGVLSVSGAIWVAPFLVPLAVIAVRNHDRRLVGAIGVIAAIGIVLMLPSLVIARQFYELTQSNILTVDQRLGNLFGPLELRQMLGVWPAGDFRMRPVRENLTLLLLVIVSAAAAAGLVRSVRRRDWGLVLYPLTMSVTALVLEETTSPWIAGKAYATAAPAFVLLALVGAAGLRARAAALGVALVVAGGVAWSNALAYHAVWLAPRDQLAELESIGERFAGAGPALMTEYQVYGVRHFLRHLDAEGASELRRRLVLLDDGSTLDKAAYIDIDRLAVPDLFVYKTLVLRRSPVLSRPPSPYELAWRGRFYDVWRLGPGARVTARLPLGDWFHPAAVPSCADIRALAARASASGASLVGAARENGAVVMLPSLELPTGWTGDAATGTVTARSAGSVTTTVSPSAAGSYTVWLGGSSRRKLTVLLDGRRVGEANGLLTYTAQWTPVATVALTAAPHTLVLRADETSARPGEGGEPFPFGPLAVTPVDDDAVVERVEPRDAESLCGRMLDWVELVEG